MDSQKTENYISQVLRERNNNTRQKPTQENKKNNENELHAWTSHYHSAMNTLGLVYSEKGEYEKACEWFAKSAEAAKALYGKEHREYKAAINNLETIKGKINEGFGTL